tara:strand:+ start:59 stop:409 length:351 start_codon:yes stop_codon:yes gene_type:complete
MNLYINKKLIGNYRVLNNSFYSYVEINDINSIEIKPNFKIEIFITDNRSYFKEHIIDWVTHGLINYNIKNNHCVFLDCDMYDDFLEFKVSIKKENNKIYLNGIKHIINLEDIIFKK